MSIRKAEPTRRSATRPGRTSAREVAGYLRRDCRGLRDSLQLEMVAAQYDLALRSVLTPEGVQAGDAISAAVVAELERRGDPLSHAILRALAHVGTAERRRRSGDAVARLAERDIGITARFADVATARAVGAWRAIDSAGGGEYALFVDYEFPRSDGHSIVLFVVPRRGGSVKHIALMHPVRDFDPDEPFHPSAMEKVEIAAAGELMSEVLESTFGPEAAGTDDYRVPIAAARARAMS